MPRTIDQGFRDFLIKLTPSSSESDAAKRHRASIEACLKSNFDLQRFFRMGSFGNATSISGFSDVDYFASIPHKNLKQDSGTTLTKVRDALDARFPNTSVRVNCPAVKVPFGIYVSETTEVVPADLVDWKSHHVYEIPNCAGGWMLSSPDAHNSYVRNIDQKLGGKVKPLIRFVKAWKYYRQVPISSFYLELRIAKYAEGESAIIYDMDVKRVFALLDRIELAVMQDPMGVSGSISPCSTSVKLADAKSKLSTALSRAERALEAKDKGDIKDAFDWWSLVYDGQFPSFYY